MMLPRSATSLVIVESVNAPSDSPLPEKEKRRAEMPAAASPSARAMRAGLSLLPVTPCPSLQFCRRCLRERHNRGVHRVRF